MISWITIVILSAPRWSTSGRAPWFSAIIRFWMSVESLKRPPTLFTISSSFNSSSIEGSSSRTATVRPEGRQEFLDATVEVVIDELLVVPVVLGELDPGLAEPPQDRRLVLGPTQPQPRLQLPERRRPDEQEERRRGRAPNLQRPLHLDLEQHRPTRGQRVVDRLRRGPIILAVVFGPF